MRKGGRKAGRDLEGGSWIEGPVGSSRQSGSSRGMGAAGWVGVAAQQQLSCRVHGRL